MKAWVLLMATASAATITEFENKCVSCVLAKPTDPAVPNFYCSKTGVCSSEYIENASCEQGIATCLNYQSTDLGVLEIPPFTKTKSSFNFTVRSGHGTRFAISNQDSKVTGWFKLMLMTAPALDPLQPDEVQFKESDTTAISSLSGRILSSVPTGVNIYYYNQNTGNTTANYIYSQAGKAYLKPLNTRFLFIGSNDQDVNVYIVYGNMNLALLKSAAASLMALAALWLM